MKIDPVVQVAKEEGFIKEKIDVYQWIESTIVETLFYYSPPSFFTYTYTHTFIFYYYFLATFGNISSIVVHSSIHMISLFLFL